MLAMIASLSVALSQFWTFLLQIREVAGRTARQLDLGKEAAVHSDDIGDARSQPDGHALGWAELLEAYRSDPQARWSAVLLDRLGPWLTAAKRQLPAVAPYMDADDVAQELAFEVLRVAARWRPGCEDGWIPRRLVERAARRVNKGLLRERFATTVELGDEIASSDRAEPGLVFDTPIGKATASELRVLYRFKVLREPLERLARESGLTTAQMRQRIRRALAHARGVKAERDSG